MKKFVVVGEGNKKGQIGKQIHDLYGGASVDIEFDDGYVLSCQLSDLRELDDSPIAAGDEVVCVDVKIRSGATGEHDGIKLGASYFPDFVSETGIYFGTSGWDKDRFVKVKPHPLPEVKQEAAETEIRKFAAVMDGSNPQWFFTEDDAIEFAKENVLLVGEATECKVFRLIASVELIEPKVTRLS